MEMTKEEIMLRDFQKKWQELSIPVRVARCIAIAYKTKQIRHLSQGIEMILYTSVLWELFNLELSVDTIDGEEGWKNLIEYFEVYPVDASGDYIAHYCEERSLDKKERDKIMKFSHILEVLIIREGLIHSMKELLEFITKDVQKDDNKRRVALLCVQYLFKNKESLLEEVLTELNNIGFDEVDHGFQFIRAMFCGKRE